MVRTATCFHPDLYERVPFCNSFREFRLTGWVAALYPAFMQPVLPLRAPMKSADSHLIQATSSKLVSGCRHGSPLRSTRTVRALERCGARVDDSLRHRRRARRLRRRGILEATARSACTRGVRPALACGARERSAAACTRYCDTMTSIDRRRALRIRPPCALCSQRGRTFMDTRACDRAVPVAWGRRWPRTYGAGAERALLRSPRQSQRCTARRTTKRGRIRSVARTR